MPLRDVLRDDYLVESHILSLFIFIHEEGLQYKSNLITSGQLCHRQYSCIHLNELFVLYFSMYITIYFKYNVLYMCQVAVCLQYLNIWMQIIVICMMCHW